MTTIGAAEAPLPRRRGRRLGEALRSIGSGATPDPEFGDDMEAVRAAVGSVPDGRWVR